MMPWRDILRLTPGEFVRKTRKSLGFTLAYKVNGRRRERFVRASPDQYLKIFSEHKLPGVGVVSLCGAKQIYDQTLSILSFLRHTGIPESWTIASDNSLTSEMEERLRGLHPVVRIVHWQEFITDQSRACVELYAPRHPMGKKLAIVTGLPTSHTSMYIDTDILFFPGAFQLRELLLRAKDNYCMEDWAKALSQGMVTEEEKQLPSLNAGFLIQARPVAWDEPLQRLLHLVKSQPDQIDRILNDHCLEQTIVNIAYHACGAKILDPELYVLIGDDVFGFKDRHARPDRVLRHYLSFVRMKMWSESGRYLR